MISFFITQSINTDSVLTKRHLLAFNIDVQYIYFAINQALTVTIVKLASTAYITVDTYFRERLQFPAFFSFWPNNNYK